LLGHEEESREWIEADADLAIEEIGDRLAKGGTEPRRDLPIFAKTRADSK